MSPVGGEGGCVFDRGGGPLLTEPDGVEDVRASGKHGVGHKWPFWKVK